MEPELEHTLPGVPGSQGAGAGTEEDSKRVALCACVCVVRVLAVHCSVGVSRPVLCIYVSRVYVPV